VRGIFLPDFLLNIGKFKVGTRLILDEQEGDPLTSVAAGGARHNACIQLILGPVFYDKDIRGLAVVIKAQPIG
jgi:hypothetical protein